MKRPALVFLFCLLARMGFAQIGAPEPFYAARDEIRDMLEGNIPLSYERAVFVMENAYWGNRVDDASYQRNLDYHTINILRIIQANRDTNRVFKHTLLETAEQQKDAYEKLLTNWAIFKYMSDTTAFTVEGQTVGLHLPLNYTRSDPMGVVQWEHTQVLGLLDNANSTGNCYALASLFYIFSNRLNSEAYINTAPGHIYITHKDEENRTANVDLATRSFPGVGSMMVFTYTTDEALQNGISLRTLTEKQAIGLCLVYLAKSWQQRFGEKDNSFMMDCAELCLTYDTLNLNAMLLKAEILENRIMAKNKTVAGLQGEDDFKQYETLTARLYNLGYREMPIDMKNLVVSMMQHDTAAVFLMKDHTPDLGTGIPYATLSGGLFDEMHYPKAQEQYGSAIFDTRTQKIIKFVPKDTLYNNYPMDLTLFGWSVDPMAHARVSWTPYNAMRDNPILNIDPTGALDGDYYSTSGEHLGNDGKDDDKVYVVHGNTSEFNVNDFKAGGKYEGNIGGYNQQHNTLTGVDASNILTTGTTGTYDQTSMVEQLPVSHSVFLMVAGIAYNETYADRDIDKFRVANTILNRNEATRGFTNDDNIKTTLAKLSGSSGTDTHTNRMDPNRNMEGQSTDAYSKFYSSSISVRNSDHSMRMSIAAAANAFSLWGTDYSLDAKSWRGQNSSSNRNNRFKASLTFEGSLIQFPLLPVGNFINFDY